MRKSCLVSAAIAALFVVVLSATPVAATQGYCGLTWGSRDKVAEHHSNGPIAALRAGHHPCFDRFVVEVAGPAPGWRVGYRSAVLTEGEGKPMTLRGQADLQVTVLAPAYADGGDATVDAIGDVGLDTRGFPTIKEVEGGGSFEGQTTFGLGVRARLPFRTFVLPGPGDHSRIVVDIAHRWS